MRVAENEGVNRLDQLTCCCPGGRNRLDIDQGVVPQLAARTAQLVDTDEGVRVVAGGGRRTHLLVIHRPLVVEQREQRLLDARERLQLRHFGAPFAMWYLAPTRPSQRFDRFLLPPNSSGAAAGWSEERSEERRVGKECRYR